jgi:hypothetical protein
VTSLYPKKIGGQTYWYLREMARVEGKPKRVSERYVGTAAEIEALLDAREAAVMPDRARHLAFGNVAAAWGCWLTSASPASSTRPPGRARPGCRCPQAPTWRWPR